MLGAIIGDIVGSRWEFDPTNDYNFEFFSDRNSFTDDTVCTVAVADALLRDRDFGECIHDWCRRYPHPMGGYGASFAQWVRSDHPHPYGSFGNGAAMRVSPVAWFYNDVKTVLVAATATAVCTHNHPEGKKGAQTVALAMYDCRTLRADGGARVGKDEIVKALQRALEFSGYDINLRKEDVQNKFDETCQGTVPVALWIVGESHSFEDAVRKAVSLGADADTLGAIVGSIAEVIWGIPEWMEQKALTYLPEEMRRVLLDFRKWLKTNEQRHSKTLGKEEMQAAMYWQLGLGDMSKVRRGEDGMPPKTEPTTKDSWKTLPMPDGDNAVSVVALDFELPALAMDELRKGHYPASMDDHWFMYCDDEHLRYFRCWEGSCAFEAHYFPTANGFAFDRLRINRSLCNLGVNSDDTSLALFYYLLTAELGGDAAAAWREYQRVWEMTEQRYS